MTICKNKYCKKQAIFNIRGLKPIYCVTHKTKEMVIVKDKTCETVEDDDGGDICIFM